MIYEFIEFIRSISIEKVTNSMTDLSNIVSDMLWLWKKVHSIHFQTIYHLKGMHFSKPILKQNGYINVAFANDENECR